MKTLRTLLVATDCVASLLIGLATVIGACAVAALLWEVKQNPSLLPDSLAYLALLVLAAVFAWAFWPTRKK